MIWDTRTGSDDMNCELHVAAIIRSKNGLYLLNKRPATKNRWPNLWANIGGRVEIPETPDDAVRREVREEIGLHLAGPAIPIRTYRFDGGTGIKYLFTGLDEFEPIQNDDGLFTWLSIDELRMLALNRETVPLLFEDHEEAEKLFPFV